MRKQGAEQFIRFIWVPKAGDRVVARGIRTTVESYELGEVVVAAFPGETFTSLQLQYRPLPVDYMGVLDDLYGLFKYREWTGGDYKWGNEHHWGQQVVGIRLNGRVTVCLRGRPRKILTGILELRIVDSAINEAINKLVFSRRGNLPAGGLKLVSIT